MLQIKTFDDITSNLQEQVNEFLSANKDNIVSVTPLYNTINGGIQYVILYNTIDQPKKARKHTFETLEELNREIEQEIAEDKKQHAIGFYFHVEDDEITDKKVQIIDILYRDYLTTLNNK